MSGESRKLRKEDLREDEFLEWLMKAVEYVRDRYPSFLGGLIAVVLIIVGADQVIKSQARAREKAAAEMGRVLMMEDSGDRAEARRAMQDLIQEYAGTPAAGQMMIMLANRHSSAGEYDTARQLYERYLRQYGDTPMLVFAARSGLAAILEAQGQPEQAALEYLAIEQKYPGSLQAALALWEAAQCYGRMGQMQQRHELLDRLMREYDHLPLSGRARAALAMEQGSNVQRTQ